MSGHTVRKEFIREFRGLSVNSLGVAITIVASYLLQMLVAIGVGYWLLQMPASWLTGLALVAIIFFIGTRLRGFNNIVHECSHFSFTQERDHNVLFGRLCVSLLLGTFADYREWHMTHHAHVGDYDKDLDLQSIRSFRLEDPLTPLTLLRHIVTPLLGLHLRYMPKVSLSARDGTRYRVLKLGLIAAAGAFFVLDPLAAFLLVLVPFVWAYSTINYWTECIDHAGLVGSEDELEASRNFIVPKQIRAILFPRNDCFHLIHHLFPQVPVQHFDACHARLLEHPDYKAQAMGSAWQSVTAKRWWPRLNLFHAPDPQHPSG